MFEKSSRLKLRFETNKGLVRDEDLWDLALESLNTMAIGVKRQLVEESGESFIKTKTKANVELELKLEILVHIINTKIAEKEVAKAKATKKAQLDQLNQLLANKKMQDLENLSSEELEKRIAELQENA